MCRFGVQWEPYAVIFPTPAKMYRSVSAPPAGGFQRRSQHVQQRSSALRRTLSGALVFLWIIGALSGAWPTGAPTTKGTIRVTSAVNGGAAMHLPSRALDVQLAAMKANGIRVVRGDAAWADIEPQPQGPTGPRWELVALNEWVKALAMHHLTWEPIIDFSVWWAKTCPGFCAPASNSTYAAFAREIADQYGAHGVFWAQNPRVPYYPAHVFEIWNEENSAPFAVPAARYASLYSAARTAIHSVDPGASVIVGGLADDSRSFSADRDYPAQYVEQMFASDPTLKGAVDGFGLHPFGSTASDVEHWVADFRAVLRSLGEGTAPIDITELGWPTGDDVHEIWRAAMMRRVASDLARSNCGIGLLAPYDWINPSDDDSWSDFGLVEQTAATSVLRHTGKAWFDGLSAAASQPELELCR
jgi:hypothetical protein